MARRTLSYADLPPEVKTNIYGNLEYPDLRSIAKTSKQEYGVSVEVPEYKMGPARAKAEYYIFNELLPYFYGLGPDGVVNKNVGLILDKEKFLENRLLYLFEAKIPNISNIDDIFLEMTKTRGQDLRFTYEIACKLSNNTYITTKIKDLREYLRILSILFYYDVVDSLYHVDI